ncbi:MAG TPA: sugar porter family MFS transporter [Candidatus Hydrogenedentes bacterium]|nr:sugar porter family MFS transporter [Candidatus Hydrogenedentota bacterium]HPG67764.1 sugar porter family MFS transporter [Candidatus Hydrogenedentota bacterium]
MSPDSQGDVKRSTLYAFGVAFVASVGGFLFGYDLAIVCGANLYLKEVFHLSSAAFGFATGSAALGCIIGPFLGGWMCDALGRNKTMMLACALLGISALFTALPKDIVTFNIFRIVGGVGVGLCSVASPMYISEISPPRMRGGLGIMYQLAIVVGSIAAPFVSFIIIKLTSPEVCWRWMFASELLPVTVFLVLLSFLPQSPRWLAGRGRNDEALDVLARVDGPAFAEEEMKQIQAGLDEEEGKFSELFAPGIRYAFGIGLLLAFFNNWTGWSVMGGYIPMLFEASGLEDRAMAFLQFAVTYGFMGLVTLAACWTVDRVGRRPLWLAASALMCVVTAMTGAVFHFHLSGGIVLLLIILCTVPHGLALGPLPWLMMSEIFPTRLRARAVSLTTAFLWVTIYSGAQLFPIITDYSEKKIGSAGGAFWLFSLICVFAFLFGLRMLPETRGRVLEEIAASWKKR